jgi:hypothetical protein
LALSVAVRSGPVTTAVNGTLVARLRVGPVSGAYVAAKPRRRRGAQTDLVVQKIERPPNDCSGMRATCGEVSVLVAAEPLPAGRAHRGSHGLL